jgi:hypothetical protein
MASTPKPVAPKSAPPKSSSPTDATPSFGWNDYAERINGRFAMIGFVSLLVLEVATGQTFFSWIGVG